MERNEDRKGRDGKGLSWFQRGEQLKAHKEQITESTKWYVCVGGGNRDGILRCGGQRTNKKEY